MTVGTDKHPATEHREVRAYLARLETAAARLAPGRREELMTDIRAHLVEALAGSEGDDRAVREALDRLGEPDDIVAAETGELPLPAVPASGVVPEPGRWGPLEVIAVLGLTVGTFLLPVVGPLVGLITAWLSARWTTTEKVVATLLTALPLLALGIGAAAVIVMPSSGFDEQVPIQTHVESPGGAP